MAGARVAVRRRSGTDVYVTQDVPLAQALMGTGVKVPTIEGDVELAVPPCTQVRVCGGQDGVCV